MYTLHDSLSSTRLGLRVCRFHIPRVYVICLKEEKVAFVTITASAVVTP